MRIVAEGNFQESNLTEAGGSLDLAGQRTTVLRVGRRIMWYLIAIYVISIVDRANLGFAALSMNKEIGLTPQTFTIGASLLFLATAVFELPSNLILAKYGARITLTRICIFFGAVTMGMALIIGQYSFYSMRLLLGIAEAGLTPGVFLVLTYWVPSAYRARYNASFLYAIPIAYLITSFVSGAILRMDGTLGIAGWRWLFILEGIPAILLGIFGAWYLTDKPAQAMWLRFDQRDWLTRQLEQEASQHNPNHGDGNLLQVFSSFRIWFLILGYVGIYCGNAVLFLWLPQILHERGVAVPSIGPISAAPSLIGAIGMAIISRSSDRSRERIFHTTVVVLIGAAGYACVAYTSTVVGAIVGYSLAGIGVYSSLAVFWSIPQTILSDRVKPGAIALISSAGAVLGGWLVPTFVSHIQAVHHSLSLGLYAISGLLVVCAVMICLSRLFGLTGR
ncbi:MFS transporter [Paraburkholderia graminis]|uniref:MFS transporter n=1 Tax=Paraburkholderia graminis TaxID=60548 RepID=UPI0038BA85EE